MKNSDGIDSLMKAKLTVYYTDKGCGVRTLDEYQNAETYSGV
jgi:hypothetical protein